MKWIYFINFNLFSCYIENKYNIQFYVISYYYRMFLRETTIMMLCVFFVGNKKWLSEGLSQFFLLILSLIHSPNEILNSLPVPSSRHFPLHGTITFKVKKVLTYRFRFYTLLPIFYYLRFTNVLLQVDLAKDAFAR